MKYKKEGKKYKKRDKRKERLDNNSNWKHSNNKEDCKLKGFSNNKREGKLNKNKD